jgi:nucleoside-diphosphate kinase
MTTDKEAIEYGKDIIRALAKYMTAGPSIALIVEGHSAVNVITKMVGTTEPATADIGTIRGDFCVDTFSFANLDDRAVRNLVHCSEDTEEAERELQVWFNNDEIIKYNIVTEKIMYDVNLDGIMD